MNIGESFGYLVNRLAHEIARSLENRLRPYGVTTSQWAVLALLWQQDGLAQVEIQSRLGLEGATVTGLVQRMARQDLLYRTADPADRRVQRVCLTEKGKALQGPLKDEAATVNEAALQGLSRDEREFLIRLLRRALANF